MECLSQSGPTKSDKLKETNGAKLAVFFCSPIFADLRLSDSFLENYNSIGRHRGSQKIVGNRRIVLKHPFVSRGSSLLIPPCGKAEH